MLASVATVEDEFMSVLDALVVDMTASVDEVAAAASEVLLVVADIESEEVPLLIDDTENGAMDTFIIAEAAAVDISLLTVDSGTEICIVGSVLMLAVNESVIDMTSMDVDIIESVAPGQPLVSVQMAAAVGMADDPGHPSGIVQPMTKVELTVVSCICGGHPDVNVHPIIVVD